MKKSSLMGASVVAAALLAAAPIVAPAANIAVSGTQVVKADDQAATDVFTTEAAQKIKSMSTSTTLTGDLIEPAVPGNFRHFYNQLGWVDSLKGLRNTLTPFNTTTTRSNTNPLALAGNTVKVFTPVNASGNEVGDGDFLRYFFSGNAQVDLGTSNHASAAQRMFYTMKFDYSNAIGTRAYPISSTADAVAAKDDLATNGGTVTMSVQLYDGAKKPLGDAGLLKSTVSYNVNNQRAAYVNYDASLKAHVGDSASIFGLANSFMNANGSIKNYNGDDITKAAYDAGAISVTPLVDSNNHPVSSTGAVQGGNFVKTGDYYQNVVVNLNNAGLKVKPADWAAAAENGLITVNGQTPSTTNSDASVYLVTKPNTIVDTYKYQPGDLVMKRTVNVSKANLSAKEEKVNGVVTVKNNGQGSAQLYTRSGDPIVDRALATGSNWKTDVKRTVYANGEVYYRVSTDEFIKASDVTFSGNDESSATTSSIKGDVVVTPLAKRSVVHVESAVGFNTSLWSKADDNKSMNLIADRTLAGNSNWQTDQTATVNGQTFYRVSTNEWINAKYVSVK